MQVVSPEDAATLRGPDRAQKVADLGVVLLFDGTVEDDGGTVKVRVHLDDPVRHVTLWSGAADGASDKRDQVQATIASEIVAVLACSNRALTPAHGLTDPDLLSRYLHACDIFVRGIYSNRDMYDLLASLREVSAKAPDFVPAHSDLAKFALYFAATLPPEQASAFRKEGAVEARKALALDPEVAGRLSGLVLAAAGDGLGGPGKAAAPRSGCRPRLAAYQWFLGKSFLSETGRHQEAAGFLQRAATANLQIDWGPANAGAQCGAGQFDQAMSYLSDALKRNPNDFDLRNSFVHCLYLAQRWCRPAHSDTRSGFAARLL